jgi:hypothetical protein
MVGPAFPGVVLPCGAFKRRMMRGALRVSVRVLGDELQDAVGTLAAR